MPIYAQALGCDRPWRAGASLREVELGDQLVHAMGSGDASLADLERLGRELAQGFPAARLSAALRAESGTSLLFEVADGELRESWFDLVDPDSGLMIDPDSDAVVLPEILTRISAERIRAYLVRRYGPCVEVVDDAHLAVSPEQRSLEDCRTALGIVAQLAEVQVQALVEANDGHQYLASMDRDLGCRIHPLQLTHENPALVERFVVLASLGPPAELDWHRPEVPDELANAEEGHALVQVANARLSSGTAAERLDALARLVARKPEGWIAELLAAAESVENRSERFAEVRKALYRALARVADPRVSAVLWQRLRDEDDELSRTISHALWQQPALLTRIPRAVIDHWDDDREFAVRLVVAAIDAHLLWPPELAERTPQSVLSWLRKEGLVQAPSGDG